MDRGFWARHEETEEEQDDERLGPRLRQVVPFVEDRKNCLLVRPARELSLDVMASLQAALKAALQVTFQLEDTELAAEPLPSAAERRILLFYESAEGGAGVLRRLVKEPAAFHEVVRRALEVAHFHPDTGEDQRRAPGASDECATACYDCLMSYTNQPDHALLDRRLVRDVLLAWRDAHVASSGDLPPEDHLARLLRLAGSELERRFLRFLAGRGLNLPDEAQRRIEACGTTADFFYAEGQTAVYIDGPHHDHPERQRLDRRQQECLEDLGVSVLRFGHEDDWAALVARHAHLFGRARAAPAPAPPRFEPDLFPAAWQALLARLAQRAGVAIEPGEDVAARGRVAGTTAAEIRFGGRSVHLVAAGSPECSAVLAALQESGRAGLAVDPDDAAAEASICARLGIPA